MPIYELDGISPDFEDFDSNWIAPDATLIGKLRIGRNAGFWYGSVLRGDNDWIEIGAGTNIQEHCVLHTDMGFPLTIGENCTIGHRAILHGCTLGNNTLIGMGAIVLNGSRIGNHCLVGAGALVTEGKSFPDNSLIIGSPARAVRELDAEALADLPQSARRYAERGHHFKRALNRIA